MSKGNTRVELGVQVSSGDKGSSRTSSVNVVNTTPLSDKLALTQQLSEQTVTRDGRSCSSVSSGVSGAYASGAGVTRAGATLTTVKGPGQEGTHHRTELSHAVRLGDSSVGAFAAHETRRSDGKTTTGHSVGLEAAALTRFGKTSANFVERRTSTPERHVTAGIRHDVPVTPKLDLGASAGLRHHDVGGFGARGHSLGLHGGLLSDAGRTGLDLGRTVLHTPVGMQTQQTAQLSHSFPLSNSTTLGGFVATGHTQTPGFPSSVNNSFGLNFGYNF